MPGRSRATTRSPGSEALPQEKLDRDPWLKRMFLGYAFAIDYRDRRGHAHMLKDQEHTKRLSKPQSGSCLHCHASVMPLYRALGDGDVFKGLDASFKLTYQDMNKRLHDSGHRPSGQLRRLPRSGVHEPGHLPAGVPQEAARVLGEAVDFARQGQVAVLKAGAR